MLYSKVEMNEIAFRCQYGDTSYWLRIRLILLQVSQGGHGRLLLMRDYRSCFMAYRHASCTCLPPPPSHIFVIFDKPERFVSQPVKAVLGYHSFTWTLNLVLA
ncbi:hypothetical protein QQF64_021709 [Cirrhinus molitorella]|uniref:Uncharacterized protein n=1 Tax=Cirrhinus molitorella TaxID=172907 RepID=A0ABR3L629_9TELE